VVSVVDSPHLAHPLARVAATTEWDSVGGPYCCCHARASHPAGPGSHLWGGLCTVEEVWSVMGASTPRSSGHAPRADSTPLTAQHPPCVPRATAGTASTRHPLCLPALGAGTVPTRTQRRCGARGALADDEAGCGQVALWRLPVGHPRVTALPPTHVGAGLGVRPVVETPWREGGLRTSVRGARVCGTRCSCRGRRAGQGWAHDRPRHAGHLAPLSRQGPRVPHGGCMTVGAWVGWDGKHGAHPWPGARDSIGAGVLRVSGETRRLYPCAQATRPR